MELRRIARETCNTLVNYLTYQAVRVVLSQVQETNPSLYVWLHQFTQEYSFQYSEDYLKALYKEQPDLALRMMTVRTELVEDIADTLPEMSRSSVEQSNMNLRRHMLEHLTQAGVATQETNRLESEEL